MFMTTVFPKLDWAARCDYDTLPSGHTTATIMRTPPPKIHRRALPGTLPKSSVLPLWSFVPVCSRWTCFLFLALGFLNGAIGQIVVPTESEIASYLPQEPRGVGFPITNRAAWETASKHQFFKSEIENAESFAKQQSPELTDALFNDFFVKGSRDSYEKPFRKRTSRLVAFVLAECVQNKGTYLPLIESELNLILNEKTWALPHTVQESGGKLEVIDLAPVARAWTLATVDYWLGDKLVTQTRAKIRSEIHRRVLDLYPPLCPSVKVPGWITGTNNVNSVNTASILGTVLTLEPSKDVRARVVQAAMQSFNHYLEGFPHDGYCEEGVAYWIYGFGSYLCAAEMVYQQTQGHVNLYRGDKQRQIAEYFKGMEIIPGVYPAFGDAPITVGVPVELLDLINQRWGMGWKIDCSKSTMFVRHSLGDRLFGPGIFAFPMPMFGGKNPLPGSAIGTNDTCQSSNRTFFPEANVLISRAWNQTGNEFGVALKGGTNIGYHGHRDLGSYVVAYKGVPLILDPGKEEYTKDTFGAHRYESMMMNSMGHDVPLVEGALQAGGPDAVGKITSTRFSDDQDVVEMDLTHAYATPQLAKLTRTYKFDRKAPSLEVIDEVDFKEPSAFGTAVVTTSAIHRMSADTWSIKAGGASLRVRVSEAAGQALADDIKPVTGISLPKDVHPERLGWNMERPVKHASIYLTITPE